MPGTAKSTVGAQASAVEVAFRLLSGMQSGPKAGTKERAYIAAQLADAVLTLRFLDKHRDEFIDLVKQRAATVVA